MIGEKTAALNLWHVLDRVAAPIFIKDRQHRVIFANRALCDRSRYSAAEFLQKVDRIFSAELHDDEAIFKTETQVIQSGYLYDVIGTAQEISIVKTITKDANGTPYIVATINDSIVQSESTQLQQEIQERKVAEAALMRSQQRLTLLVQQSPFMFIEWSANYKIQTWNSAAQTVFGYRRSEAVGQLLDDILPELGREEVLNQIAPLLTQSGVTLQLQFHVTQSGKTITCEWYHYPLLAPNGSVMSIVSMGIDVTDRVRIEAEREQTAIALKQSEAQLRQQAQELEQAFKQLQTTQAQLIQTEKMSSLGQLVAGIAHEINNPVSFIYGNLEPAKQYIEDLLHVIHLYQTDHPVPSERIADELQEIDLEFALHDLFKLLDSMGTGAERIRDIVRSLRNFSRHDEAELKAVDLHEGIDSTLMLLQHLLKSSRTAGGSILRPTIQIVKAYDTLPKVQCYAGLLNQVFINLLSNAIDAINARWRAEEIAFVPTIEIHTSLFQASDSVDWVRICMIDNGIGMTAATHQRLFDPFFTTKPIGQGSGLGLSVSYQIVTEQHGGQLRCDQAAKRGATFIIEIPVKQLLWS